MRSASWTAECKYQQRWSPCHHLYKGQVCAVFGIKLAKSSRYIRCSLFKIYCRIGLGTMFSMLMHHRSRTTPIVCSCRDRTTKTTDSTSFFYFFFIFLQSSGAVWKSRWTSWAPVPNKPMVSMDVKQHFSFKLHFRYYPFMKKGTTCSKLTELWGCVKVDVAVLGSPSLIVHNTVLWT